MTWTPDTSGSEWNEETWLALGETDQRTELFDGGLYVSSAALPQHQRLSFKLTAILDRCAATRGLEVYQDINLRLKKDRVPRPDLVVVTPIKPNEALVPASAARLVCEIVSPSNPANDRVLKTHYYAEARIPWYLLVEQEPEITLRLLRYDGGGYVEHAIGRPGTPLTMTDPVTVEIDPSDLLG